VAPLNFREVQNHSELLLSDLSTPNKSRVSKLIHALHPDGTLPLHETLNLLYPEKVLESSEKKYDSALTALRQLRQDIRELEKGIELNTSSKRLNIEDRSVFFEKIGLRDEKIAENTQLSISLSNYYVDSEGLERDEMGRIVIKVSIWGCRKPSRLEIKLISIIKNKLDIRTITNNQFRFIFEHIDDVNTGENTSVVVLEKLKRANLIFILVKPKMLMRQPSLKSLGILDEKYVFPVLIEPISEFHNLGDLEGIKLLDFDSKALSEQSKKSGFKEKAAQEICEKIAKVIQERIVPLTKKWKIDETLVNLLIQELIHTAYIETKGISLSINSGISFNLSKKHYHHIYSAIDYLNLWLRKMDRQPYMALLGEYGMGKTTTIKAWAKICLEEWYKDKLNNPLPIYIDLNKLNYQILVEKDKVKSKNYNAKHENFGDKRLFEMSAEEIIELTMNNMPHSHGSKLQIAANEVVFRLQNRGAVLIIDSLDEVLVNLSEQGATNLISKLLNLLPPWTWIEKSETSISEDVAKSKVVRQRKDKNKPGCILFACRTHYFRSLQDLSNQFLVSQRGEVQSEHFDAFMLLPFNRTQILEYLRVAIPDKQPEKVLGMLEGTSGFSDLITRPYHLKIIAEFYPDLERQRTVHLQISAAFLYEEIVKASMLRDKERHWLRQDHKLELLEEIAWHLHKKGEDCWHINDLENWFLDLFIQRKTWQRPLGDQTPILFEHLCEDLRTATFLVHAGTAGDRSEWFKFAHRSMFEFFLARSLIAALTRKDTVERWAIPLVSDETFDFIEQMIRGMDSNQLSQSDDGILRIKDSENAQAAGQLLTLVFAHLTRHRLVTDQLHELSILRLPNLTNGKYYGVNFQQISERYAISGIFGMPLNFTGSTFYNIDISGLILRYLNLTNCRWENANLQYTKFIDCILTNAHSIESTQSAEPIIGLDPIFPGTHAVHKEGHFNWVDCVKYTNDGKYILSASRDKTGCIWDADTGKLVFRLVGHSEGIRSISPSPDGSLVTTGSTDGTVHIWDFETGKLLSSRPSRGQKLEVLSVAFSSDSSMIVSTLRDQKIRVWDVRDPNFMRELVGHTKDVRDAAFFSDNLRIISAGADGTIRIWCVETGRELSNIDTKAEAVFSVALTRDNNRIASAYPNGTIEVWDLATRVSLLKIQAHSHRIRHVEFSPDDSKILSCGRDGMIRVWDSLTGARLVEFQAHKRSARSAAFSKDGTRIVSGSKDNSICVWSAAGTPCFTIRNHSSAVRSVRISSDNSMIVSGSSDGSVRVWDLVKMERKFTYRTPNAEVYSVDFSRGRSLIASGLSDGTIQIWDVSKGNLVNVLPGHESIVRSVRFSQDGSRLVSGSNDGTVRYWDPMKENPIHTLIGDGGNISSVRIWNDTDNFGKIASSSSKGKISIWDLSTMKAIKFVTSFVNIHSVSFSSDGHFLVFGQNKTIKIADLTDTSLPFKTLETGHSGAVLSVAFSNDSRLIVSGSEDNTVRIWDVQTGKELHQLNAHLHHVTNVTFSNDDSHIVSSSRDGTWILWTLDPKATVISARRDADGRLDTEGITRAISGFSIAANPLRNEPDTFAILDLLTNKVLASMGDTWKILSN
jgi:WD40 repeat protein